MRQKPILQLKHLILANIARIRPLKLTIITSPLLSLIIDRRLRMPLILTTTSAATIDTTLPLTTL